jgi:hypothetical protein
VGGSDIGTRATLCGAVLAAGLLPAVANAELLYGIGPLNQLISFDSASPSVAFSHSPITGLIPGEALLGLDQRPATGGLYSLGSTGNLYRLQNAGATYSANLVGAIPVTPTFGGLDFNPVLDGLRYVDLANRNLRINPDTAVATVDMPVSASFPLVAAAYSNNLAGATMTTLYGITDAGRLVLSTAPNTGVYMDVGPLGVALPPNPRLINFDISGPSGVAYLSGNGLYTVNLATGAATLVGPFPPFDLAVSGLTAAGAAPIPEPSAWGLLIAGFGCVGAALRSRRYRSVAEA